MAGASRLVSDLPKPTVVLDHLGKPGPGGAAESTAWAADVRALAAYPQVVAKLSGLGAFLPPGSRLTAPAVAPVVHVALEAFGPDRLMLGSDWPVSLAGGTYAEVTAQVDATLETLSPLERADLQSRTAQRIYRL